MNCDELKAAINSEIAQNARIAAIRSRMDAGTADFLDSELYTAITAEITAEQMRRNVLALSDREPAFVGVVRERYTDTFSVFNAVQRILDAVTGIRIRTVQPEFENDRAHKIGHSLNDPTVPESVIERRAYSATENFVRSQHDRCTKANASFRSRAGLDCRITRTGGAKCCDWCASVSGSFTASSAPDGIWGRHDNCKCSITYETRRGSFQQLSGSGKGWDTVEELPDLPLHVLTGETAGAGEVHAVSAGQAAKIEAKNSLTISPQGAIMETERSMHFRNFRSASAYMEKKYDLSISGLEQMPLENLKAVSDCIHRMYRDIPMLDGFIDRIVLADMNDIARAAINLKGDKPVVTLKLSRNCFTSMSIAEIEDAIHIACENNIFSMKNGLYGIFKHEAVHFVEYLMTLKKYGRNSDAEASLKRYELASQIVDLAFAECGIERTAKTIPLYISDYATESAAELIAEAYSSEDNNRLVDAIKHILMKKWGLQ